VFVKYGYSILIKELILKPYTKFEFKSNKQTRRRRGESLPGKPGGTGFGQCAYSAAKAPVQRFWRFLQRFRTFQKLRRKVRLALPPWSLPMALLVSRLFLIC
jgi:hypothetical protein